MTALEDFMASYPLTFTCGLVFTLVLVGGLRNSLVRAIQSLFEWVAAPVVVLKRGTLNLGRLLSSALESVMRGLGSGSAGTDEGWSGWNVIFPLIWLGLGLIIGLADFYLVGLALAAMLGVRANVPSLGITPDLFMAFLFSAVITTFSLALPELHGVGLGRFPWTKLSEDDRAKLKKLCMMCFVLTLLAAGALWLWRDQQRSDMVAPEFEFLLEKSFWILLVLPVVAGTAIAFWAASKCVGAACAIVLLVGRAVVSVVEFLCQVAVWTLWCSLRLVVSIIDIPACLGAGLVNFFTRRLPVGIEPIVFEELTSDFAKPAFLVEVAEFAESTVTTAAARKEEEEVAMSDDLGQEQIAGLSTRSSSAATIASARGRRRYSRVS